MQAKPVVAGGPGAGHELVGAARQLASYWLLICALFCVASSPLPTAADSNPAKNVLILYSFTDRKTFDGLEFQKSEVRSHLKVPVDFQVEYLESERFETVGYELGLLQALAGAYQGKKFDLVIVAAYPALRFATQHRDQIFPGVPIVFLSVAPSRIAGQKLWPGVTGVTTSVDVAGTIALALRLHPDTGNVAVISGGSEFERYWLKVTDEELRLHEPQLKIIDLVGYLPEQLLKAVAALPPHTVVLFQLIPQESSQPVIGTYDLLAAIAQRFPTYCIHNYCLEHGAVGGSYPDASEQQTLASQLAARVLSGEKPDAIPVLHGSPARAMVDWRQLRRWNIAESALPSGAIVGTGRQRSGSAMRRPFLPQPY